MQCFNFKPASRHFIFKPASRHSFYIHSDRFAQGNKGISLLETIFTIAIISITLSFAIPSFSASLANNRLITSNNSLITSLTLARQKAIGSSVDVYLCELTEDLGCNQERSFNANWSQGWLVFADTNGNRELDETDTIIEINQRHKKHTAIVFNQRGRLRFRADGTSRSAGFYLCNKAGFRHIYLLHTGRPRTSKQLTIKQQSRCLQTLQK
ncbi:MAG: GspH/FimT family pseudopilin [Arenicella sp.]